MRAAAGHELAVVPRGGGSRLGWGTPPSRCDLVIDMSRMAEVLEHAAGDLVARVQAGARMGDVAAVLAQAGQEIALDVPGDATVGGVVASGLAGPRRLRYGTPRDLLIGITIVRADGTVAKSGGKVVKNVAGYDLGKLFAGSAGTLGLITEATFRLHPLPAARRSSPPSTWPSPSRATRSRRRRTPRSSPPRSSCAGGAGRADPGRRAARGVGGRGRSRGPRGWPTCSATARCPRSRRPGGRGAGAGAGETLVRVSFWVSALGRVLDAIDAAAARARVAGDHGLGGRGVLYAVVPAGTGLVRRLPEAAGAAEFVAALREAVAGERRRGGARRARRGAGGTGRARRDERRGTGARADAGGQGSVRSGAPDGTRPVPRIR